MTVTSLIKAATTRNSNNDITYRGSGKIAPREATAQNGLLKSGFLAIVSVDDSEGTFLPADCSEEQFIVDGTNTLKYNNVGSSEYLHPATY